jgi:hypothetical protein
LFDVVVVLDVVAVGGRGWDGAKKLEMKSVRLRHQKGDNVSNALIRTSSQHQA